MNIFQKSLLVALAAAPLTFAGAPAMANFLQVEDGGSLTLEGGEFQLGNSRTVDRSVDESVKNVNRNRNVNRSRQVNRNNQSINIQDAPEAVVAPVPNTTAPGQVGDVIVPLPTIGVSAFGSRDNNVFGGDTERSTVGIQAGFSIPLGTGQTRRAADQVIAQREAAMRFQLIQEAAYMLEAGVLSEEVHPEHWAALYGTPVAVESYTAE